MTRIGTSGWARSRVLRPGVALMAVVALMACAGRATTSAAPAADAQIQVIDQSATPAPEAPADAAQAEPPAEPAAEQSVVAQATQPAVDCTDLTVTPAQTEGPYWTPDSPERTSLLGEGMAGTRLVITGYVVDTNCQPIAGALLDFWQADDAGNYDNAGYTLRGHQYTDENGRYELETIVPGLYPGRTRHIHVKVRAPGGPVLTPQLYFPDEPGNARDGIFRRQAVMNVQENPDGNGLAATFNFVVIVQ